MELPLDGALRSGWLESAATTDEAAALLAELVAIRSLVGEEGAVQERVAAWLSAAGLSPEVDEIEPNRPNVTVPRRERRRTDAAAQRPRRHRRHRPALGPGAHASAYARATASSASAPAT